MADRPLLHDIQPEVVETEGQVDLHPELPAGTVNNAILASGQILPTIYNGEGTYTDEQGEIQERFDRDVSNQGWWGEDSKETFTAGEQIQAFFETENTLASYAAEEVATDVYDPDFDVVNSYEWAAYPELQHIMVTANNQREMEAIVNNQLREQRNREIIELSSTPATLGYSALAMALDPVLLPAMLFSGSTALLGRLGTKGTAALWGGTAGTSEIIAEVMKHDSQQLRTPEESFINVAATTFLSGLLGAGVGKMSAKELAKLDASSQKAAKEVFEGTAERQARPAASVSEAGRASEAPDSVGAARVMDNEPEWQRRIDRPDDLQLKKAAGLEKFGANPLVRLSKSSVPLARKLAVMLADSPYYYKAYDEGRAISGSRGTIEGQKRQYIANHVRAMDEVADIYANWRGKSRTQVAIGELTQSTKRSGEMTYRDFQKELGASLRRAEPSSNEAIRQATDVVRNKVLNPIMEDGINAGLFDEGIRNFAQEYFPRLYDFDRLSSESDDLAGGFSDRVFNWLAGHRDQANMDLDQAGTRLENADDAATKAFADLERAKEALKEVGNEAKAYKQILKWDIDPNDAAQVQQALGLKSRPLSLSTFIRENGGMLDDSELIARDINNNSLVGIQNSRGYGPDHWIRRAVEEGYYDVLPENYNQISHSRFYDDLAQDIGGEKLYTRQIKDNLNDGYMSAQQDHYFKYATEELGLSRKSTKDEIDAAVARDLGVADGLERQKKLKEFADEQSLVAKQTREYIDGLRELADMTDDDLRDAAAQVKSNILGLKVNEFNESLLPDKGAFKAGNLKERRLTIPDTMIEDYLISDADDVLDFYTKSVAPQVSVAREFGDIKMTQPLEEVNSQYLQARNDLERRLIDEGAPEKTRIRELQKMDKEQRRAIKDLEALRDKLYGQYNRPQDPSAFWVQAGNVVKTFNYMRMLGGMTISALPDLARPVMTQGFGPVSETLFALRGNKALKEAALEDLKASGVALDSVMTSMTNRFADLTDYTGHRTKMERQLESASNIFSKLTFMPQWNDALKGFSGLTVQNQMAKAIRGTPDKRQLRELAKQGIGEEQIKQLRHYLDKYGKDGDLFVPNAAEWADEVVDGVPVYGEDMRSLWRSAVGKTVNEIIVTPGIGEMPLWVSGPVASVVMQFKSFPISAHNRVLMSGLQAKDKQALGGLLFAVGMGAMVNEIKAAQSGRPTPDNVGDRIYNAVDRAGVMGWLNEPIQFASMASRGTLSPNQLWGSETVRTTRYQSRNLLGSLIGPTGDLVGDLGSVSGALATGDWSDGDVSAARKLLPYQNLFYFDMLLKSMQE